MDLLYYHKEIIKIPGYPGYEASRNGHIYSLRQGKRKKLDEYLCNERAKYKHVVLRNTDGKPDTLYVHRLIASIFLGPCPKNYRIVHRDNNTFNNAVKNLIYREIELKINDTGHKSGVRYLSLNEIFSETDEELFFDCDDQEVQERAAYIIHKIKSNKLTWSKGRHDFYKTLKEAL